MPAEPGYTKARIAPRLGRLQTARGAVPTPFGPLSVEVSRDSVTIDSPIRSRSTCPASRRASYPPAALPTRWSAFSSTSRTCSANVHWCPSGSRTWYSHRPTAVSRAP